MTSSDTGRISASGRMVLIVDDDPMIRHAYQAVMPDQLGVKVLEAADGMEAVDKLLTQRVDLVVLDIQMPRLNGFEVLSFIHHHPAIRHLPVVIVTSLRGTRIREKTDRLGIQYVLSKPLDLPELINAVRASLCY